MFDLHEGLLTYLYKHFTGQIFTLDSVVKQGNTRDRRVKGPALSQQATQNRTIHQRGHKIRYFRYNIKKGDVVFLSFYFAKWFTLAEKKMVPCRKKDYLI